MHQPSVYKGVGGKGTEWGTWWKTLEAKKQDNTNGRVQSGCDIQCTHEGRYSTTMLRQLCVMTVQYQVPTAKLKPSI